MNHIQVLRGDITQLHTDAIVNAANSSLMGGGGVDGAIHRAGGPKILEECRAIVARQGGCKPGEAVITSGGKLPARWVIHTVGPIWNGGHKGEAEVLANCYRNSLQLASDNGIRSIGFPNISTGVYRFPKAQAAAIAVTTTRTWLAENEGVDEIIFVCFDEENLALYQNLLSN